MYVTNINSAPRYLIKQLISNDTLELVHTRYLIRIDISQGKYLRIFLTPFYERSNKDFTN